MLKFISLNILNYKT